MKNQTIINEEIICGRPLCIESDIKREIIKQIQDLGAFNYEDVCFNMRLCADIFEILENNINDEFILLKYNPMGEWEICIDDEEIEYYKKECYKE